MNSPSRITTHVLDIARGRPAAGIPAAICIKAAEGWKELGRGVTNQDGRITELLPNADLKVGRYRLTFDTAGYLATFSQRPFFPEVAIAFEIHDPNQHYHVPLLLSPYGYSTYRGS